jgi:glycosyltransferase involved in cell wall biosynthesis
MIEDKKIAVVMPAYNEELLIEKSIDSVPSEVSKIIVINDLSKDNTKEIVENKIKSNQKIVLINNKKNYGVGYSIVEGYKKAYDLDCDIAVVMPGDAQALPEDFYNLIDPVVKGSVDYTKGNRLKYKGVSNIMPKHRFFGNTLLTLLTKFASGYYHIMDPQMGYTALNLKIFPYLELTKLIKRYGYPGHLLYILNLSDAKVADVEVKPHYGEEKSGIKLITFVPKLIYLLIKLFISRVFRKLILENLSPAGISYLFSFLMLFVGVPILSQRAISKYLNSGYIPELTFIALTSSIILFFIFFLFGVLFDVQENKELHSK